MPRFTAHVSVHVTGGEDTIPFEVDDETLAGLSPDAREERLTKEAEQAINDAGLVDIWFTDGAKEE